LLCRLKKQAKQKTMSKGIVKKKKTNFKRTVNEAPKRRFFCLDWFQAAEAALTSASAHVLQAVALASARIARKAR